jgi:divalent metal cation (Fe/Co/Zn/Cd) transporter
MRSGFMTLVMSLVGALLAWMGCFVAVYLLSALGCARNLAAFAPGSLPLTRSLSIVAVAGTAAFTAWLLRRARKLLRTADEPATDGYHPNPRRFAPFVSLLGAVLALIALAWLALPPLLLPSDC